MRILQLMPYDAAKPGGVQTHAMAISGWLRSRGHKVVLAAPASGTPPPGVAPLGRPIRRRLGGTDADLLLDPRVLGRGRALAADPGWDIIHIQEPLLPALGPVALTAASSSAKLVCTLHSAEPGAARAYRMLRPLTRRMLSRADALIAVSNVALSTAAPALPGPVRIIPPAIAPLSSIGPDDAAAGAILFVGRDEPRKGLSILIRAVALLGQNRAARVVVAGPVSDRTRRLAARLGIAERVGFLGPVPPARARGLMSAAAAFCSPALGGEALGLTLIEAMSVGAPVVASDIAGYRIATRNGRDALLVPPGDADALSAALDRVLQDDADRARLIDGGRAGARRFSASIIGRAHEQLYQRLLADPA